MERLCRKAGIPWHEYWFLLMTGAAILGALAGGWIIAPLVYGLPTLKLAATLVSDVVPVDGSLKFLIDARGRPEKTCPTLITRQFHRMMEHGGRTIPEKWRDFAPGPITIKGEEEYVMNVPLPPNAAPGEWYYTGRTISNCGVLSGGEQYIDTPVMKFRIVPKGSQ